MNVGTLLKRIFVRRSRWVFGGLVVALALIGAGLLMSTRDEPSSGEAIQLAGQWGLTSIPAGARGKVQYVAVMGEETTSVYIYASAEIGGLGNTLATLPCFTYSNPQVDGLSMYKFLSSQFRLPAASKVVRCGTCKLDGASQVRFIRFTSGDLIQIERTKL